MKIRFEKISPKPEELNQIAQWRNLVLEALRTGDFTSPGESQIQWTKSFSQSDKYFFIYFNDDKFIGYCGLDKFHPINRTAEISLLIGMTFTRQGIGREAVKFLLHYGFDLLNLNLIFGEVYLTTTNSKFWLKQGFKKEAILRHRKYWKGKYYNSMVFSITQKEYQKLGEKLHQTMQEPS